MEIANTNFNVKYFERTQELGATPTDTMKENRGVAAKAYYDLRDFIDSYFTINKGAAPFGKTTK